jgi:hypothetical protein
MESRVEVEMIKERGKAKSHTKTSFSSSERPQTQANEDVMMD